MTKENILSICWATNQGFEAALKKVSEIMGNYIHDFLAS